MKPMKLDRETIQQRVYYVVVMRDPKFRRDTFIGYTGPAGDWLVSMPATHESVRDGLGSAYVHADELRARTVLSRAKLEIDAYRKERLIPLATFKLMRVVPRATFRAVR